MMPTDTQAIDTRAIDSAPGGGCHQTGATSCASRQRPARAEWLVDALAELQDLRARVRAAEHKASTLEAGLLSNRRIGMAVGILMCRLHLTEDDAFELLRQESQRRNTKVRVLAETVIYTGTL
jgi:AmiR/NasT family two-component response regulator